MKKTIFTAVSLLCLTYASHTYAQRDTPEQRQAIRQHAMERIQEAKWSFIVYRLNLSKERSNKLLPIYQDFEAEKRNIARPITAQNFRDYIDNANTMSDEQANELMNARLEYAQKLLDLKEQYKPKFLTALSPKELLELQNAEQEFLAKILRRRKTLRKINSDDPIDFGEK